MNVISVIQARMSSVRLPGKVLMQLVGKPVLEHVVTRIQVCTSISKVIVATSTDPTDNIIQSWCESQGISCYRGSLDDVLDRYYQAAKTDHPDAVVRITADCPAIDPTIVDEVVTGFLEGGYDYYGLSGEFPDGLDCTVFKFAALERAWREARLKSEREHVGPYLEKHPELFKNGGLKKFTGLSHHRWTLDEPRDYEFLQAVFARLQRSGSLFLASDVLFLLEQEPDLMLINSDIIRNEGYLRSLKNDNKTMYTLEELKQSQGVALYKRAINLIPGGTQLLSKRPEMFAPEVWPSYYSKAKGCRVWDMEGREFIDISIMAVGACILGYADDEVDDAVVNALRSGVNSSLNCTEEVELAEALIALHPWFGMVRYARSGGESMGMAIRIARAHTHRDLVMFSGYHGWNDWYLATNLADSTGLDGQLMPGLQPNGVPRGLAGTAMPFDANNIDSLREKIRGKEKHIAAIVIEPARGEDAPAGYLKALRELASEIGAVLIFDEITSGFRMCAGGIHRNYGVHPDMAVLAKSMANGYAMAVVMGIEKVMQAAQSTFISSTNWTERIGPTAALATLRKYQRLSVEKHLIEIGNRVKHIWRDAGELNKLEIKVTGLPSLAAFSFKGANAAELETLFTIEMLKRGFLGFRQFKPSLAHQSADLDLYQKAVHEVFAFIAADPTASQLDTPVHHSGFQRLTKE